MNRFFVLPENIKDGRVTITGSDVNHIKNVLRLKKGVGIAVFDGTGEEYTVRIEHIGEEVAGTIIRTKEIKNSPGPKIVLWQGLPKGPKIDFIIQKCTEVGVSRIVPLLTERTIVKIEPSKSADKQKRWQKIAKSAAEQSRRTEIPLVERPLTFEEALAKVDKKALNIIPWEIESGRSLREILKKNNALIGTLINIFIGPEGGFTYREVEQAKSAGLIPVSLGQQILRTETAGLAVVIMVLYETGTMG
ncbi:MAG: 16S rRNA (uracil(1498)-N(3))-methyltransferase [bacterium]